MYFSALQHLQNRASGSSGWLSVITASADLIIRSNHKGMAVMTGIPVLLPDLFNMFHSLLFGMHRKHMRNKP